MTKMNRRTALRYLVAAATVPAVMSVASGTARAAVKWTASIAAPDRFRRLLGQHWHRIGDVARIYPRARVLQSRMCGASAPALRTSFRSFQSVAGTQRMLKWRRLLRRLRRAHPLRQLYEVQAFVNRVPFADDRDNYQNADHWACPSEFFSGGGDCEDYAIAKYASLRRLGFAPDQLRIVLGYLTRERQFHAFLAVEVNGETLILDNRREYVVKEWEVRDFRPIMSLNDRDAWVHT